MKKFLKVTIISIVLFALVGWLVLFDMPTLKPFTDYINGSAYNQYDFYNEDTDFLSALEKSSNRVVTITTKEQSRSKGAWKNDSTKETMFAKNGMQGSCLFYIREKTDEVEHVNTYIYHKDSAYHQKIGDEITTMSSDSFQIMLINCIYLYDAFDVNGNVIGSDLIFESDFITSRSRQFAYFTTTAVSGGTKVEVRTWGNRLSRITVTETYSSSSRKVVTYDIGYSLKLDFSI